MTWDVRTRVRQRIARLLEDRGWTNRRYAQAIDHREQWVSNMLAGRFSPKLDELDRLANPLGVPASELVRQAEDLWELSPSEMRVMRALRMLPPVVRDHFVTLADYLVGVTPDEIDLLRRIRDLEDPEREVIDHWLRVRPLLPALPPAEPPPGDTPAVGGRRPERRARHRGAPRTKKRRPPTDPNAGT